MIDQLIIEDKASFDDFGASLAKRNIGMPPKKSIKETVPFSNKTYDFSAINGEIYWEERELEYIFEMTAPTPEELEEMKAAFSAWVMAIHEARIYDPFIEDYHFVGTFDEMKFEDDEGLDKTTVTVAFTAYPYKVANIEKQYKTEIEKGVLWIPKEVELTLINNSAHPVVPKVKVAGDSATIEANGISYALSEGEYVDSKLMLAVGSNTWVIQGGMKATVTVEISFNEEVF